MKAAWKEAYREARARARRNPMEWHDAGAALAARHGLDKRKGKAVLAEARRAAA